jgi:hypothetical protein
MEMIPARTPPYGYDTTAPVTDIQKQLNSELSDNDDDDAAFELVIVHLTFVERRVSSPSILRFGIVSALFALRCIQLMLQCPAFCIFFRD